MINVLCFGFLGPRRYKGILGSTQNYMHHLAALEFSPGASIVDFALRACKVQTQGWVSVWAKISLCKRIVTFWIRA